MVPGESERMAHGLQIQLHLDRGVPVLVLAGDLDLTTADELRVHGRELVDEALDRPRSDAVDGSEPPAVVVLDASGVTFVDSSGLGAVVSILKRALAHRAGFSIAGSGPQLRARLAQTGLDRVVALHASTGEAVVAAIGPTADPNRRIPEGGHRAGRDDGAG